MSQEKKIDFWQLLIIIVVLLTVGGGFWITGKGLDSRLDEVSSRIATLKSENNLVLRELTALRKELQKLGAQAKAAPAPAATATASAGEPAK